MNTINMNNKLNLFLDQHKWSKGENKLTHTKIGSKELGIFGGSYSIPEEKLEEFYKLYHETVFVNNNFEYLTERQDTKNGGPIYVDLDFRYELGITERQHDDTTISDIASLYTEKIFKLLNIKKYYNDNKDSIKNEFNPFEIMIFQKDNINILPDVVKDGIHLIINIHMDHIQQLMLRDMMLTKSSDSCNQPVIIYECLGDLDLKNSAEDILDEGISKGHCGWQLYGSRKPGNEAYKLTNIFKVSYKEPKEEYDDGVDITEETLFEDDLTSLETLLKTVVKNKNLKKYELNESYKELYEKQKKSKKKRIKNIKIKKSSNKITETFQNVDNFINTTAMFNIANAINNEDELDAAIERLIMEGEAKDYLIKETHKYTMLLDNSYYDPYNNWYNVGCALNDTSPNLFLTWMKFSAKSEKFDYSDIPEHWETWSKMVGSNSDGEKFTVGSIHYWARTCDPEGYAQVRNDTTSEMIVNTTKCGGADYDMALLAKHLFGDKYKCVNIKNGIWYEYQNNRWVNSDTGNGLRQKLSSIISKLFIEKSLEILDKIRNEDLTQEEQKTLTGTSNLYNTFASKLRSKTHKTNVMFECRNEFYDVKMENLLDQNPMLLCFKNGVFDFDKKVFRPGKPEDYVSKCTNIDYINIDRENPEHIKLIDEINLFMSQVFPNEELRKYMWEHVASAMIGRSNDQTFNIYNGENGSNGKSKFVEFMGYVFGDYKGTVPISLITATRPTIGSTSSEIVQLKGIRYACINEPTKGMKINEGVMKEITGGDPLTGRALYKESITFTPQLKLVCCTNTLFEINSTDGGTWRRIKVVEFQSRFCDNPSSNPKDLEFKKINNLPVMFKRWAPMMASLLVEIACKTNGNVTYCDLVQSASKEYQQREDYLSRFVDEKIEKGSQTDKISKTSVQEEFKQWYEMEFGKKSPGTQDLIKHLNKKLGKYKRQGWSGFKLKFDTYNDEEESDEDI